MNSSNLQRPVVERGRQPEAVVDQGLLARAVAVVHAADLRDRLVRLVDEGQEVLGEVVEQRVRRRARARGRRGCGSSSRCPSSSPISRIISRSYSVRCRSRWASRTLPSPRSSARRSSSSVRIASSGTLDRDPRRSRNGWPGRSTTCSGHVEDLARQRVEVVDRFDLVAEELRSRKAVSCVRRHDLDHVAAHPEGAARRGSMSLRSYWMSTSLRRTSSRSTVSPDLERACICSGRSSGEPMP